MKLTKLQSNILQLLVQKMDRITNTEIARLLTLERALVNSVITQLSGMGLIINYGVHGSVASDDGIELVKGKKPSYDANKPAQQKLRRETVARLVDKELAALETVAPETEPAAVHVAEIDISPAYVDPYDIQPENKPQLAFDELVQIGLKKLNDRLGFKPQQIDRLDLKIDTLNALSEAVGQVDANVQDPLLAIIIDLQNVGRQP